ncbi:MAG: type I-F CRISPR-associated protein Csy3 [Hydrogenophaga sp.]|nr:type I-F CRISPR-associated protein Csy3 [Hydrogenophaga sp.]
MATKNTTATPLKTASVLAFERKLDPSDALFAAGTWASRGNSATWEPVVVREKSVRGTASHRSKTKGGVDVTKQDMKFESPNPQTVDVATLPAEADTLKVSFTLRVLGGTGTPSACNNAEYQSALKDAVQTYVAANGFAELARRYAANLANGRFLWRNRLGAEQIEVQVARLVEGQPETTWTFDALSLSLRDFDASESAAPGLKPLADVLAQGLAGQSHVLLQVTAFVRVGAGQEVYPSQELILDKDKAGKSKTLYTVNGVAGMHSQKLGNAIRTIDTWYTGAADNGPIAVEPYGSVTTQGKAYRQPKAKEDFYTLFDHWVTKGQAPATEQQHFVIATLIRGGVFGDAGKE